MLDIATDILRYLLVVVKDVSPYVFAVIAVLLTVTGFWQSWRYRKILREHEQLTEQKLQAYRKHRPRRVAQYLRRQAEYERIVAELIEDRRKLLEYLANASVEPLGVSEGAGKVAVGGEEPKIGAGK